MSKLARYLVALSKKGTPIRHARGVVVSSTTGQTVVTLDGGSTNVTAYNYSHVQSLPAGAVVDLLLVGNKAYVIGYYGVVPVGGLVVTKTGPASTTNYSTTATVFTQAASLVAGLTYQVTLSVALAEQITSGGNTAQVYINDSGGLITTGGGNMRAIVSTLGVNEFIAGSSSCLITPGSTASDTFTVQASAGASLQIPANNVSLIITRVA